MKIYIVMKMLTRMNDEKVTSIYEKAFTDKESANKIKEKAETTLPCYKSYDVEIKELELVDETQSRRHRLRWIEEQARRKL